MTLIFITLVIFCAYLWGDYFPKRRVKDREAWQAWDDIPDDALICRVKAIKSVPKKGFLVKVGQWKFKYDGSLEHHLLQLLGKNILINGVFIKNNDFLAINFEILGVKTFIEAVQAGRDGRKIDHIEKKDIFMVYPKKFENRVIREEERRANLFIAIEKTFGYSAREAINRFLVNQRNERRGGEQ